MTIVEALSLKSGDVVKKYTDEIFIIHRAGPAAGHYLSLRYFYEVPQAIHQMPLLFFEKEWADLAVHYKKMNEAEVLVALL